MKTFPDYVKLKEDAAQEVGRQALGNISLGHSEKPALSALFKLSRLAWDRNRDQMVNFFGRIAATDPDIKASLEELVGDKSAVSRAVRKAAGLDKIDDEMDKDEITPNDADKNGGAGGEDDGM